MDMQALLADFLNDLEAISDDELLAELETAKRDSENSFLLDTLTDAGNVVKQEADVAMAM